MYMVTIITDSTADLSPELVARHQLVVIPLLVNLAGNTYFDGVNLSTDDLFELVNKFGKLPQTAAPSIVTFQKAFNQPGEFVYIGLSSQLSSTFQNATLAAADPPQDKVHLVDSLNLSTGIGLLVCKAAELRDQGLPAAKIAEKIKNAIPRVRTSFVIETMDYLYKGGRCTPLQHLVGSLLRIRPVIEVKPDGTMGVKDKIRGTRKKALDSMLIDLQAHLDEFDRHRIFITHTGCNADAQYLADEIRIMCSPDEICITRAGTVVTSHCGPNTIGILYLIH
jgi:DegV family protein with EDD domain